MKINLYKILLLGIMLISSHPALMSENELIPVSRNSKTMFVPLTAITDISAVSASNSMVNIDYTDGLNNPCMNVQRGVTPSGKDLVSVMNTDCYGRVINLWLPTPLVTGTYSDPESIKSSAQSFYSDSKPYESLNAQFNLEAGVTAGDTDPESGYENTFTEITYCSSGEAWHDNLKQASQIIESGQCTPGGGVPQQMSYRNYTVENDCVKLIEEHAQLITKIAKKTDEDGKESYVFIDAWGRTLLRRNVSNGVNHDTYFVYDDLGNLRFVLSPEASDRMATAGTYSLVGINTDGNPLAQYGYAYKYDGKGRCIAKKLPGKDWNYMMYDQANHLIFSQDGNQRPSNQWTFYKYDGQDRLIQSGTATITNTAGTQTAYNSTTLVETYVAGTGYTSSSTFTTWCTNIKILTQNFYDSYNFLNLSAYSAYKSTLTYMVVAGYSTKYSNVVDGVDIATQGMLTGTTVAMLDNSATTVTSMYYNDKGQVVQSQTRNTLNGYTRDWYTYSFTGKMLRKLEMHNTIFNVSLVNSVYNYKYDSADRLTDIWHKQNSRTDSVKLCSIQYDELGRPSKKILHGGIQSIDYTYNIHNQLKSISSPLYAETLHYEDGESGDPLYNGNISAIDNGSVNYTYSYDGLNRLVFANHTDYGNPDNDAVFSESSSYDKNGNIQLLARGGWTYDIPNMVMGVKNNIDELSLSYSGNQLKKVTDGNNTALYPPIGNNDFHDKESASVPVEYNYDSNGNMTADYNKGIALIKYNLLNLPEKIYFMNGNKIEYMYDAAGVKHKAKYTTALNPLQVPLGGSMELLPSNVLRKDSVEYFADYVYTNRVIDKIRTPTGYIQTGGVYNNWDNWKYRYFLTDHQGNTRRTLTSDYLKNHSTTVYTASGQIDYYPSGLEITPLAGTNSGTNPYLYSGKEIDRMHGLNEYDFSARWQDPAVPGFTTSDPLVENHPWESPYMYCGGNPVNRVDPTGLDWYGDSNSAFWYPADDRYLRDMSTGDIYENLGQTYSYINGDGHLMFGNESGQWEDLGVPSSGGIASATGEWTGSNQNSCFFANGISTDSSSQGTSNTEDSGSGNPLNELQHFTGGLLTAVNGIAEHGKADIFKHVATTENLGASEIKELAKSFSTLDKIATATKWAGKALGVVAVIQHYDKATEDFKSGNSAGGWLNVGKIVIDVTFMAVESSNPVFIGAGLIYAGADYATSDY